MKWEEIIGEVFFFYVKIVFVFLAYEMGKKFTAQCRSSTRPFVGEKILRYSQCVGVAAVIGFFACSIIDYEGNVASMDYNRGAKTFLTLAIAAVAGAAYGFTTRDPDDFSPPGIMPRKNYD